MTAGESVHALVDTLSDEELSLAKVALQEIRAFDLSEEDLEELRRRELECDQGQVIDAHEFLQGLRAEAIDSHR